MLTALAIENYRSIQSLVMPLTRLNVISGANGSGKSNLYRALRLLASAATEGIVAPLAREGGLTSVMWAGPEEITPRMRRGEVPIQGGPRRKRPRLRLGFSSETFGYAVCMGISNTENTAFWSDPEYKRESIWVGDFLRPASTLVDRDGYLVKRKSGREWVSVTASLPRYESLFSHIANDDTCPEVFTVRERIRNWRFYDHFRTDADAPARSPQIGTRTLALHHDGRDLAAAWQTIREIGDREALDDAVSDAFPGASVSIELDGRSGFLLRFQQHGLLRELSAAELSDGTLRYLLLIAALMTPRPPELMVLNEPEASLHPDLMPALGRLIRRASQRSQLWVVSHSARLAAALEEDPECNAIKLDKSFSATTILDQHRFDRPAWRWPDNGK
ncbi:MULTISPECIES: AAA family ATPase [Pandoraea]|uniref:AAA family ATPase n=1 Tax=Pandoraea TaxID=93217 RepID=UPI001F5CA599|nr:MULTISPECIES: AAA family ATPase [Pandoraea]MCI3203539.1 ATP-binding protein [Pandoraea sp. LA3]MDN4581565.1 ATP-binding protein [Pandoraea capi]